MFRNPDLALIAYANGFSLWQYNAKEENMDDVLGDNYFGKIWTLCACGDKILVCALDGYIELVIVKVSDRFVGVKEVMRVAYNG